MQDADEKGLLIEQRGTRDGIEVERARRLDDHRARLQPIRFVAAADDMRGHAVLDGAREVQVLRLGVDAARASAELAVKGEHRRVAHEVAQALDAFNRRLNREHLERH